MDDRFRIRPTHPRDAVALGQIERESFSDPWSEQSILEAICGPHSFGLAADFTMGGVGGYVLAREVGGSGEILNLAVASPYRRLGVGGELLRAGLALLTQRQAREVFLEVRQSNEAAIALYGSHGFRPVGLRKDYYRRPREDALVFRRPIEVSA